MDRHTDKHEDGIVTARRRFELRLWQKATGLGVAGLGLSLLLATGAMAAPPSATPGAAAPRAGTPTAQPASGTTAATGQGELPAGPVRGTAPQPPAGGPGGDGEVTAVSGNTITMQGGGPVGGGTTRAITVNNSTAYLVGGPGNLKAGSLADVKVGSHAHAEGTTDSNGNLTALVVRVEAPQAGGEVTAVSGNAITVQDRGPASNGATRTITVGNGTVYYIGGPESTTKGSLSDVQAGVRIHAEGTLNGDGSFSATMVRIDQPPSSTGTTPPPVPGKGGPRGDGTVTAVSGSTITVQDMGPAGNGGTRTITVTGNTIYLVGGPGNVTKGSLSDVQAGVHVHAEGTTDGSGNLTAVIVRIDQAPARP